MSKSTDIGEWQYFTTKEEAELLIEQIRKRDFSDYSKLEWAGPGNYFIHQDSIYFRRNAYDTYSVAEPAYTRFKVLQEEIERLQEELELVKGKL